MRNRKDCIYVYIYIFIFVQECIYASFTLSLSVSSSLSLTILFILFYSGSSAPLYRKSNVLLQYLFTGKAVFCEKPITSDRATTKALYDLATKKNKPLFCAFHRCVQFCFPLLLGFFLKEQM